MLRSFAVLSLLSLCLAALAKPAVPDPASAQAPSGTLPDRLDLRSLSTSERLRFAGLRFLPHHGHLEHRLCLGDPATRDALLVGIRGIPGDASEWLRQGYGMLALAPDCRDGAPHAAWLAESLDRERDPDARDFLWERVAYLWSLDRPLRFEEGDAPDEAVLVYYGRLRPRTVRWESARLDAIVRQRFATRPRDTKDLQRALRVYARFDHPRTAATLLALHEQADTSELRALLWRAMMHQSDPTAQRLYDRSCRAALARRLEAWRAQGAPPRGSPFRFGHPCRRGPWLTRPAAASSEAGSGPEPTEPREVHLADTGMFQFKEDARLLRQLARLVRPDLDEVTLHERWPAVDAVPLSRGPHPVMLWVHGDGVEAHVRDLGGVPDSAQAEAMTRELEAALLAPREIETRWRGEERRFRFLPQPDDRYDVDRMLEIVNTLLETVGSAKRIVRLDPPERLKIEVVETRAP